MHAFEFSIPTRIVFGPGTESRTGELAAGLGARRVLLGLRRSERPSQRAAGPCGAVPDPGRTHLPRLCRDPPQPPPVSGP